MEVRRSSARLQRFLDESGADTIHGEQLAEKLKLRQYLGRLGHGGVDERAVAADGEGVHEKAVTDDDMEALWTTFLYMMGQGMMMWRHASPVPLPSECTRSRRGL